MLGGSDVRFDYKCIGFAFISIAGRSAEYGGGSPSSLGYRLGLAGPMSQPERDSAWLPHRTTFSPP